MVSNASQWLNTWRAKVKVTMGKTFSPYISDDNLVEWVEERAESDDYRNMSHVFEKAISTLRREESEELL